MVSTHQVTNEALKNDIFSAILNRESGRATSKQLQA